VVVGGTTDLTARLVVDGIRESVGQPVVVENRPGATGRIAAEALKHAAADGTTFLLAPTVVTMLAPSPEVPGGPPRRAVLDGQGERVRPARERLEGAAPESCRGEEGRLSHAFCLGSRANT
jgi:Tripartite tricarboxylate transporter family receptor